MFQFLVYTRVEIINQRELARIFLSLFREKFTEDIDDFVNI